MKTTGQSPYFNTMYKIYAAIIKNRLEAGVEDLLHTTQFGFRKRRGTSDAIHCIRRVQEFEEQDYGKCLLVLLDWEKAFDKIDRDEMWEALQK